MRGLRATILSIYPSVFSSRRAHQYTNLGNLAVIDFSSYYVVSTYTAIYSVLVPTYQYGYSTN